MDEVEFSAWIYLGAVVLLSTLFLISVRVKRDGKL